MLGLPQFSMIFRGLAVSAIERSARGIVACILKDDTEGGKDVNVYKKVDEVDFTQWSEANHDYFKLIFAGAPSTVIAIRLSANAEDYNAALSKLKNLKWNYLTIPEIKPADVSTVAAWIKQYRNDENKTFKAVLAHCAGDHEGIINLTTENISSTITERSILQHSIVPELLACLLDCHLQEAAHILSWMIFQKRKFLMIQTKESMLVSL